MLDYLQSILTTTSEPIEWLWVTIINLVASIIWTLVLVPQSWKTLRTRDTVSVSLIMYILYPIGGVLWISYAAAMFIIDPTQTGNIGIIITDSIGFFLSLAIVIIKIRNMHMAKKMKLSELEYYEKYIKNNKKKKNVKK